MNLEAITPRLAIPAQALVLEIGSGHRPHPCADVLTDKYLEDIERGGRLVTDRPFVQADAERLPFKPQVFDYAICRHVLEHLEDPGAFFQEVSRVARAGYIEAPTAIWERLHPSRPYHRWYVLEVDGELLLMPKPPSDARSPLGRLFETLNRYSPEYRLFIRRYADLFYVRHRWRGRVRYRIVSPDAEARAWFLEPWDAERIARFVPPRSPLRQALDLLVGAVGSVIGGGLRRLPRPSLPRRRRPMDLAALMQCPHCAHQTIVVEEGHARCPTCGWQTVVVLPS